MTAATARTSTSTSAPRRAGSTGAATGSRRPQSRIASSPADVVRPHLRVFDQQALRRRARRRNAAMVMFVVLIIGFFAAALAQAQLVANQHELDLLRTQIAETDARRARLERSVEESSAPAAIIEPALAMGMVRANDPIYLAAVAPAPDIVPISVLGAVTASTGGDPATLTGEATDGVIAASVVSDQTLAVGQSTATDAGIAAPVMTGLAGIQAETTGIGSG